MYTSRPMRALRNFRKGGGEAPKRPPIKTKKAHHKDKKGPHIHVRENKLQRGLHMTKKTPHKEKK